MKHSDLIDLNIRPRGILPVWLGLCILVLLAKVFGAGIPWLACLALPALGLSLLNLALLYAILEAVQKDFIYLFRGKDGDEDQICPECGLPKYEEEPE